jgi:hypothetical protein
MRIVAVLVGVLATAVPAGAAPEKPSTDQLFREFDLFGTWATICEFPPSPSNPHVVVTEPNPGTIIEDHNLGSDYQVNRYRVLSAEKLSDTRLGVTVLFNPGGNDQERQKLIVVVRDKTRRTVFNQVDRGPVRVREGVALPEGMTTPLLHKCK